MGSTYQSLADLCSTTRICTIRARVARIWEAVNTKTNEAFRLHVQLLDEKDFEMLGTANKNDMDRISSKLKEGQIYEITGFVVKATPPTYQAVSGKYFIEFYEGTEFMEVSSCDVNIPLHRFAIVNYPTIESRLEKFDILTDVCGLLIGISENKDTKNQQTGHSSWIKEIILLLQCGKEILVTLWREKADLIPNDALANSDKPTTVVLTSALVKRDFSNKNSVKLSSTSATKLYFNLDVPECKQLLTKLSGIGMSTKLAQNIEISSSTNTGVNINILQLLNEMQRESCVGEKLKFKGEIVSVDDVFGWSYLSCKKCKGAAQKNGSTYWCSKCASTIDEPLSRFKLILNVRDNTADIKIVAFDKEAENLLSFTVQELKNIGKQESGSTQVKDICLKLSGRFLNFHVKPTYYDFRKGGRSLAANKITTCIDSGSADAKGKNILNEEQQCTTSADDENSAKSDAPTMKKKRKTKY